MISNRRPRSLVLRLLSLCLTALLIISGSGPALITVAFAAEAEDALQLSYTVTEVDSNAEKKIVTALPLPVTTPLPQERVETILGKLKTLQAPAEQKLVLPQDSLIRPPVPGTQVVETFPPKVAAVSPTTPKKTEWKSDAPLKVSRVSAEGLNDVIEQFAISFSQPLTALVHLEAVKPDQFVTLTPQPKGDWKWAGPQTLLFTPEGGRFPKATKYIVSVPATAKSVTGNAVEKAVSYVITTPPVKVTNLYPPQQDGQYGDQSTTPVIIAQFNQAVDAKKILDKTQLKSGTKIYPVRLLSKNQLQARDAEIKALIPFEATKYWLAFEPTAALPKGAQMTVEFEKGLPSEEGPLLSDSNESYQFKVHEAFKLLENQIIGSSGENGSAHLEFSNQLDAKIKLAELVTVSPEVERLQISPAGKNLYLSGNFKPLKAYKVTLNKNLKDKFGQTLERDTTAEIKTEALPYLIRPDQPFKTYTSDRAPHYSAWVQGAPTVKVEIRRVQATDNFAYRQIGYHREPDTIGQLVHSKTYDIGENGRQLEIDLKPYLENKYGHLMVRADLLPVVEGQQHHLTRSWIQVTDIGLDAFDSRNLEILATNLNDATPLSGVELKLHEQTETVISDKDGQAQLPLVKSPNHHHVLIGSKGADSAVLSPNAYGGSWHINEIANSVRWYTVCDRNLYKPGEQVIVKGWLRKADYTETGRLSLKAPDYEKIYYQVTDATGVKVVSGESGVDKMGGFSYQINLPEKLQLGQAQVGMTITKPADEADDHSVLRSSPKTSPNTFMGGRHGRRYYPHQSLGEISTVLPITIQEFRRPEFEMKVTAAKSTALVLGDSTTVSSSANYLIGGALANAPVNWVVTPSVASYAPPGWSGYNFGSGFDLYSWYAERGRLRRNQPITNGQKTLTGQSDSQGNDTIALKFISTPKPVPMSYQCQATVVDVNRQQWTSSAALLVHPADTYVGIKKDKSQYLKDEPVTLNVVATDLDGKIRSGTKVELEIKESDVNGESKSRTEYLSIGDAPAELRFSPAKTSVSFACTARIKDASGRSNSCSDSSSIALPQKKTNTMLAGIQSLKLTADKAEYQPGDVAKIAIESTFGPGKGALIITRNRNISNTPIVLNGPSKTIDIPITEDYYPDVRVEVYLAGDSSSFGSGSVTLLVPPKARRLALTATPLKAESAPGKSSTINLELKDAAGHAVENAQVALAVVDEAVLALTNYRWQDPMEFFYPRVLPSIIDSHSRQYVVLKAGEQPDSKQQREPMPFKSLRLKGASLAGAAPASGPRDMNMFSFEPSVVDERHFSSGRAERHQKTSPTLPEGAPIPDGDGARVPSIVLRQNFSALAVFKAALTTDANGKAEVNFTLPDSVTRYRVMALAVAGNEQFGSAESIVTTKMPMMVKPSPPRFLQLADRCELPVVIQNQTDKPLQAQIAMRADNAQILESGKTVTVPANDRVEVRFSTVATGFGKAQFQCAAVSGEYSDAAEFSLPVLVPASSETFAAYGVVDKGIAVQKLDTPKDVFPELGGLSIETSSTAVQSLTDAYIYLRDYPYSCSEQISSRLIAMLALQDTLTAFGILKGDEQERFKTIVKADIDTLEKRQGNEGGFGLWSAAESTEWPYVSIQVTRALHLAKSKDYKVNDNVATRALEFLKNIEQYLPSYYCEGMRIAVLARALNVRHLAKDNDADAAKSLLVRSLALGSYRSKKEQFASLPADRLKDYVTVEVASWLLVILDKDEKYSADAKALRDLIQSQIKETASTASANDNGGYGVEWNYLIFASPRRTDAAVLEALMEDQPTSDLIPKFVKGLLAHRKNGAWEGTQENGYILQTLDRYFNTYEKQVPDFIAQTWLGNTLLANHKFAGRTTISRLTRVPMDYLLKNTASEILINKQGQGRLYYRLALDYVPKNLNLKAMDQGFSVTRNYLPIDSQSDVRQDGDGIWHFKSGASVKVKLHFKNIGARYHVALADPLPAGAEPVNAALLGTRTTVPTHDWQAENPGEVQKPLFERCWWWRPWYEHDNLRDHQAEVFTSLLPAGEYDYTYTIQATTPGRFTVPPTKVEEMYQSETFGRTKTETVIIE